MAGPPLGQSISVRWCRYCGTNKLKENFVKVFTTKSRRFVGWKCDDCVAVGKLPAAERDIRALRLKEDLNRLNKVKAENLQALKEERRTKQLKDEING
jgi:hypothetical protein